MTERFTRRNTRLFLIVFLAALSAFGPFVTDFYLPALPMQQRDFGATPAMVQLGLSATMWGWLPGSFGSVPFPTAAAAACRSR